MTKSGLQFMKAITIILQCLERTSYVSVDGHILSFQAEYKDVVDLGTTGLRFAYHGEYSFESPKIVQYCIYLSLVDLFVYFIPNLIKSDCYVTIKKAPAKARKAK